MERQLTIGRTIFLMRRPSKVKAPVTHGKMHATFLKTWMQVFSSVWEVKSTVGEVSIVSSKRRYDEPK
jgi:hypothetical protein